MHRDISPKNILFATDGRVLVSDLGTVRHVEDTAVTTEGTTLGSLIYISRQQFTNAHQAIPSDDVFSIGQIAWELLAGHQPVGNVGSLAARRPDLPPGVADFVDNMRSDDPAARPSTAGAALAAWDALLMGSQAAAVSALESAIGKIWKARQLEALTSLHARMPEATQQLSAVVEAVGPVRLALGRFRALVPGHANRPWSPAFGAQSYPYSVGVLLGAGGARFHTGQEAGGGFRWHVTWLHNRLTGKGIPVETFQEYHQLASLTALCSATEAELAAFESDAFLLGAPCAHCGEPLLLRVTDSGAEGESGIGKCVICRGATCRNEGPAKEGSRCCICGNEFRRVDDYDEQGRYDSVGCGCRGYAFDVLFDLEPWRGGRPMVRDDVVRLERHRAAFDELAVVDVPDDEKYV